MQVPLGEPLTNLPKIPQNNFLQLNHDTATYGVEKEEPPIKEQRPATILSNVDKISPIDLPNESETNKKKETKDSTQHIDEVAMD